MKKAAPAEAPLAPAIGGNRTFRQGLKASLRRQDLVQVLRPDGKCGRCGKVKPLEVHHVDGRSWDVRLVNRWTRVKRYWDEYEAGVRLDAWCKRCNVWDENRRKRGGR